MTTEEPLRDEKGKFTNLDKELEKIPLEEQAEKPAGEEKATPEGMDALAQFAEAYLDDKPMDAPPEKKKVETPPAKKKEPTKPKVAAPVVPASAVPLTPDQIAEAAARGVATALKPKEQEKPKEEEKKQDEYTPQELRRIKVLEKMGQLNKEHKDYAEKYKGNLKKLKDYAEQWRKEHPDEEFDESDEQHTDFFEKNDLYEFWDNDDFTEALADLRADEKVKGEVSKVDQRLSEIDRRDRAREAEPLVRQAQGQGVTTFLKSIEDIAPEMFGEDGVIKKDALETLEKENPIAYQELNDFHFETGVLFRAMNGLEAQVAEEPVRTINDRPNPRHQVWQAQQEMGRFINKAESRLLSKPVEDQLDAQGRPFLPLTKYWAIEDKAEREKHWTYTPIDVIALRASHCAKEVRAKIAAEEERFRKEAERRGIKLPAVPAKGAKNGHARVEEEQPSGGDEKPISPSAGVVPRAAVNRSRGGQPEANSLETWVDKALD